jgi:chitin deacetylase
MPNVSVSKPNNGYPTYANGESGADKNICSFTYQCTAPADLWNPPDSVVAVSTGTQRHPLLIKSAIL